MNTLDDLKTKYKYDPETGDIFNKKTGNSVGSLKKNTLVFTYRSSCGKMRDMTLARFAMLLNGEEVAPDKVIYFDDGNSLNLKRSNLVVADRDSFFGRNNASDRPNYVPTSVEGIYQGTHNNLFVVRRDRLMAVYRTGDFEEAVRVRQEWLRDKSIHRWDDTIPKDFDVRVWNTPIEVHLMHNEAYSQYSAY